MTRIERLLPVLAVLAGLLACEKKAPPEAAAPAPAPSQQQPGAPGEFVLIGEVGALTGSEATFGVSTRKGVELAVKQENANGGVHGKPIRVRVYDDQGKPEEAANAVTRLISQDRVLVIIGENASSNSLAMAPVAQAAKVPMITPSSTNPKVTEVGDYIFRVCFIDPFQGLAMARFARADLGARTAAILKDQKSDYSLGLSDVFTRRFTEFGGKILATEAYAKGDTDFRAQLTAIKRHRPDVLYIPGYYTDVGVIARQARELGLRTTLLGGDGWESPKLFELGGAAVEGAYFTNHYSYEDPNPRTRRFIEEYRAEFGAAPDAVAALGYDAARVAIEAMRRAKDLTGPAIRDALAQTREFPGVAGTITIDEARNAVKPVVVVKVTGGRNEFVTSVAP